MGEGRSIDIIAPKVKIGRATLQKAKEIKDFVEKEKSEFIAKEGEKTKKGGSSVDAV